MAEEDVTLESHDAPPQPAPEAEQAPVAEPSPQEDVEALARRQGWRPKDEFEGPDGKWVDAETFVERGKEINAHVQRELRQEREARAQAEREFQERIARMERMHQRNLDQEKKRLEEQAQPARDELDFDAYDNIQKRRQEIEQETPPPPQAPAAPEELSQWAAANPWFNSDPHLTQIAKVAADRAARNGGDVKAEIAAAEAAVRAVAPDVIKANVQPKPEPKPTPTPDTGSAAARLVSNGRSRPKGGNSLPAEARAQAERDVSRGLYASVDDWAKAYYED